MSIFVGYEGRLSSIDLIEPMVEEVEALARGLGWKSWRYEALVELDLVDAAGLRGISVQVHPRCGTVHLHVDPSGRLVNHAFYGFVADKARRAEFLDFMVQNEDGLQAMGLVPQRCPDRIRAEHTRVIEEGVGANWADTAMGGVEGHRRVCDLIHHIQSRYAPDLEVTDRSDFYVTGDEAVLEIEMAQVERVHDCVSRAVAGLEGEFSMEGLRTGIQAAWTQVH